MNINQVTDHHLNSGIGRYSFELSKALINLDHEVSLYKPYKANGDDCSFNSYDWIKRINYKSFRSLHSYLLPYFIGARMLPAHADVYHAHWFMAGLGLMKSFKKKWVVTMHDVSLLHEKERSGRFTNYYEDALKKFKRAGIPIIVVSKAAKEDAIRYGGFRDDQVFAVPNGINFDQFYPVKRKENNQFKIVYAGGLSQRKNLSLLLQACSILEDRGVDYQLEIAGNHPDKTPYPKEAQALNLKNVSFVGFIPDEDMNKFYNRADLMVYTSKYEGFGFAPLEAMAAGTPVISTRGGSLQEISGGGAWLINYKAEELAFTINQMKENRQLRDFYIQKGLDWVKQYTWEQTALQTLDIYKSI